MVLARRFSWLWYHTYDSRQCEPGLPNLVLVKDRVLFRELKPIQGCLRKSRLTGVRDLSNLVQIGKSGDRPICRRL